MNGAKRTPRLSGMPRRVALAAVLALPLGMPPALAQSGARTGKEVVEQVCAKCHETGALGAPGSATKPRGKSGRAAASLALPPTR